MFTLATERVEDPVASAPAGVRGNVDNARRHMADTLEKELEEADNALAELAESTKA